MLTASSMQRHRMRSGFTLVEMLMFIGVLGVAAAIILPQIGSRDDIRTAAMARSIMADLAYVQSLAVSTQKRHYVRFDADDDVYDVLDRFTPTERLIDHPVNKTPFRITLGANRRDNLKGVSLEEAAFDGQAVLMFDELGTPYSFNPTSQESTALSAAGSIKVKSHEYEITITVEPYSGELKVN